MHPIKTPEIVVSSEAIAELVGRLRIEPVLAFDLEADSLHHYQEKVCLIQVSSVSETVLIDPLAFTGLSLLASIMADPSIRKVFHGADYDIRCLHREYGIEVNNLFDTMIACQFLGHKELGLAAVLKGRFGIELNKKYQKADWSKRPLSPEMIEYAVKDTCLLIELSRQLEEELTIKSRLSWAMEEFELLSRVRAVPRENEPLFLRFKGAVAMAPRTLAVLEELLKFRDETAKRRDLPPFKVMGPDTIRELAERRPMKPGELNEIANLTPRFVDRYGSPIIDAVTKAMEVPEDKLPHYPVIRRKRPDRNREEALKNLKGWRDVKASELKVDAWIVATNNLLEELAEKAPSDIQGLEAIVAMKRWQRRKFGAELVEILGSARGG